MNFKNLATITGLATGAAVAFAAMPAQAVSLTVKGNTCPAGQTCVDLGSAGYTVTGGAVLTDDFSDKALTPGTDDQTGSAYDFDTVNDSDSVKSYSVTSQVDQPLGSGANTAIEVTDLDGSFEFFWGSVDSHNIVEFFNTSVDAINPFFTFTGGDLAAAINGGGLFSVPGGTGPDGALNNQGNFDFDAYVSFTSEGINDFFDKVVLSTAPKSDGLGNGIAFEVAAAAAVPEPASILGLAAVGLLGGGSLLKRKGQVA